MGSFVLAFPDEHFLRVVSDLTSSPRVRTFEDAERLTDLGALCRELVGPDTEVVTVGPSIASVDALALISELDRHYPTVGLVLVHKPNADLWQSALLAGARDIIDPEADEFSVTAAPKHRALVGPSSALTVVGTTIVPSIKPRNHFPRNPMRHVLTLLSTVLVAGVVACGSSSESSGRGRAWSR